MKVPFDAPDSDDDFKLVGCTDPGVVRFRLLHSWRQRKLLNFKKAVHPQLPEEKADQVLVAFLRIDNAVGPRMAAMDESTR